MIISKPKGNALFSLSLVFLAFLGGAIMLMISIIGKPDYLILKMVFGVLFFVLAFLVLSRIVKMNKKLILNKEQIEVIQRFPPSSKKSSVKTLQGWRIDEVRMKGGHYQELTILLEGNLLAKFSNREHSNFDKAVAFFERKASKKQIK